MFQFFLRNPVCQEMGRKFKMSFSSSDKDTGLIFTIWVLFQNCKRCKRFQSNVRRRIRFATSHAELLTEFIPANQIIPTTEGILRILTAMAKEPNV
jgi:sulfite reductase (ferredoxin)